MPFPFFLRKFSIARSGFSPAMYRPAWLRAPLPPLQRIKEELSTMTSGTKVQIYWVDLRIWRDAIVVINWDAMPEGLFIQVTFPGIGVADGMLIFRTFAVR
jgi:hypothetical protein